MREEVVGRDVVGCGGGGACDAMVDGCCCESARTSKKNEKCSLDKKANAATRDTRPSVHCPVMVWDSDAIRANYVHFAEESIIFHDKIFPFRISARIANSMPNDDDSLRLPSRCRH